MMENINMHKSTSNRVPLYSYPVWDRSVRVFHWINAACIICLIGIGLVLLNGKSLGVNSDGKILLKTLHTYFGYVFVLNLIWRLIWGFVGNQYCRWKAIMPLGKGYAHAFLSYIKGFAGGHPPLYTGHNPIAKLMVTFMFLMLFIQAGTGLVMAGTDLYFPPFGSEIAKWVSASGADPENIAALKPGSQEGVDPVAYKEMRAFRKPFITLHQYNFYVLTVAILLHIVGVVVTELKEKSGLVSAMFTGDKVFTKKPVDLDDGE